jgi:succinoglycan biosynthesis transport protein ExoP
MDNAIQPSPTVSGGQVGPRAQSQWGDYAAELEQHNYLRNYWNLLKSRKWWFWGVFLSVVVLVGLYTFLSTPVYRATTILQIVMDTTTSVVSDRDPTGISGISSWYNQDRFYETQFSILKSRPLAYRIIERLNLKEHPQFKGIIEANADKSPQEIEALLATMFLKNLEIKPQKKSYLVEVSFKSPDKYLAQQVPNTIPKEYVRLSMETRHSSYELIKEWLEGEIGQLARKVEASERRLYEHGQKKDFLSLEGNQNVIVKKYTELSRLLTKAQSERTAKEAQFRQVKERGADAPLVVNNPLVQRLREEMISQEAKVSSLSRIYDINYPQLQAEQAKLRELRSRLNGEVQRILTAIRSDYEAAQRTEDLLKEALGDQKNQVIHLQDDLVQHHNLKRDLQTNEQLYQALLARMKETSIASTMVPANVSVRAQAEQPLYPYSPRRLLNMLLAVVIGLVGGLCTAFLVDYLDDSIKTTEDLERHCRVPSLGALPMLGKNAKGLPSLDKKDLELATFRQPRSPLSEAIYHIRTSLLLSTAGGAPGAIMITSANPDEGKTTVAINLATSLAMNNRKVVLIDADLRKPSVHPVFQESLTPGLSSYLTGIAAKEDVVRPTFVPNLSIVPAGPVPPNPIELLTSQLFLKFLTELRQEFHHVVIDTPPILGFADGRAVAPHIDGVIVVVKHHSTSRDAGRLAINLLAQVNAPLLGGVLTMAEDGSGYFGHYKHYAKYYGQSEVKQIES